VSLRVCYPFVGDSIGGSHISAALLIQGVRDYGISPLVILHQEGSLAEYFSDKGIAFEIAPNVRVVGAGSTLKQIRTMASIAPRLINYMRERHVDIVHTNDARMHLTWALASRLAGAAFIWHQRSAEQSRRLAIYSRLADYVITVSEFNRSRLPGKMASRAKVILNPFDEPWPPPDRDVEKGRLLSEFGASKGTRIVGYIANLANRKRPLVFAEMAGLLARQVDINLVFPMFGDPRPPLRQEVELLIQQLGLNGRCALMGMRMPIEQYIAACDVVVAPAVDEPLGRAIIEPMLTGTPVVAADHGGNREIISNGVTGLLVRPDDPAAFATAVTSLLTNADYASKIAQAAHECALTRFSRKKHVETVLQIYRQAIGSRSSALARSA
jgi:glycosyltransferase involved in cell wall biosynthesis